MYAAMWSNLSLFVLPLLTSLGLILEQEHPQIQRVFLYVVSGILLVVLALNLQLYWNKAARSQFDLLRAETCRSRRLLQQRISLGAWGLPATAIIYGALLFVMRMTTTVSWATSLLKGISLLSIIIGLGVGIFDLAAFDASNILFKVSEDFRRKTKDRERTLKTQMAKIDYVFTQWRGLASDPQLVRRISQAASAAGWDAEAVEKQLRESQERKVLDYNDFKAAIFRTVDPMTGRHRFAERILSGTGMLTLKELQEMDEEVDRLLKATTTFLKHLSDDYERWKKWRKENESQEAIS